MDFIAITENGRIRCTFTTMKRMCMFAFFTILSKWAREDSLQVPENEHDDIEDTFTNILSFLLSIQENDQDRIQFRAFDSRLEALVDSIEALKQ
jgi:hypothetical protein